MPTCIQRPQAPTPLAQRFVVTLSIQRTLTDTHQTFEVFRFRNEALAHFRSLRKKHSLMETPCAPETKRRGREAYAAGFGGAYVLTCDRITLDA